MIKKHHHDPKKMKYVQVDAKTWIEVPNNMSKDRAIANFLERTKRYRPNYLNQMNNDPSGTT